MRNSHKIYAALFAFLLAGSVGVGSVQAYQLTDCGNGNIGYGGNCSGFSKPDDTTGQAASVSPSTAAAPVRSAAVTQTHSQAAVQTDPQPPAQQEGPKATPTPAPAATPESAPQENQLLKWLSDWLTST